jgi:plastocyanin
MPATHRTSGPPISYTITIALDPPGLVPTGGSTGNFVYTPALLNVLTGDSITWQCNSQFSVAFKEQTPIGEMQAMGCAAGSGYSAGPYTVEAAQGSFHYTVAVWNGTQVYMDAGCPRVSVN